MNKINSKLTVEHLDKAGYDSTAAYWWLGAPNTDWCKLSFRKPTLKERFRFWLLGLKKKRVNKDNLKIISVDLAKDCNKTFGEP